MVIIKPIKDTGHIAKRAVNNLLRKAKLQSIKSDTLLLKSFLLRSIANEPEQQLPITLREIVQYAGPETSGQVLQDLQLEIFDKTGPQSMNKIVVYISNPPPKCLAILDARGQICGMTGYAPCRLDDYSYLNACQIEKELAISKKTIAEKFGSIGISICSLKEKTIGPRTGVLVIEVGQKKQSNNLIYSLSFNNPHDHMNAASAMSVLGSPVTSEREILRQSILTSLDKIVASIQVSRSNPARIIRTNNLLLESYNSLAYWNISRLSLDLRFDPGSDQVPRQKLLEAWREKLDAVSKSGSPYAPKQEGLDGKQYDRHAHGILSLNLQTHETKAGTEFRIDGGLYRKDNAPIDYREIVRLGTVSNRTQLENAIGSTIGDCRNRLAYCRWLQSP